MHFPYCANEDYPYILSDKFKKLTITSLLQDSNISGISESSTEDDVSRIQKTTAYGESRGSSHPSCSGSGSELQ